MVKTADDVYAALAEVSDPEIPAVSVIDLGMIEAVEVSGAKAKVTLLPTFVGCPALDVIREDIGKALTNAGFEPKIEVTYQPAWTSERITATGRKKLADYGLAPPTGVRAVGKVKLDLLKPARCPYCGSADTVMESAFGPTACRATCYCRACRNPFEQFKNV
ncbi:MAG: 1,2-phenylacetyl-CoA epoxidase subunit PaaD [Actinomycetota bacterium]|nr:phenylacetate-CoA oxygenase subunit PaaJ [Actinomycetota bacterium]